MVGMKLTIRCCYQSRKKDKSLVHALLGQVTTDKLEVSKLHFDIIEGL